MFPPNLQKNIRELDRQISLLETECHNVDSENSESIASKSYLKSSVRKFPSKPFITGPSRSNCSYTKGRYKGGQTLIVPKICSTISVPVRSDSVSVPTCKNDNQSDASSQVELNETNTVNQVNGSENEENSSKYDIKNATKDVPKQIFHKEVLVANSGETIEVTVTQKSNCIRDRENKRTLGDKSTGWITEMSESSEEKLRSAKFNSRHKKTTKEQTKSNECQKTDEESYEFKMDSRIAYPEMNALKLTSSDEECNKELYGNKSKRTDSEEKWLTVNEHSISVEHLSVKRSRPRSLRTRKKCQNHIPIDLNVTKVFGEKEIQSMLWKQEREKEEFLINLNDSIKTLHFLISELKKKSSQERKNDVLNDMQNTLMKIGHIKSAKVDGGHLNLFTSFQGETCKFLEGEENIIDLKKAFYAVKQFCEQLSDEKSYLSEELNLKNRAIAGMKNKEKEYLSLISTLKFNLEKTKQQIEEWSQTKKELTIMKSKLEEETKIIEALKRSHAKMQDTVENYVLENDKLRTQLKVTKLEAQKYNVLLAGKEEEIKKYKEEMGSFQKQICEQLTILRSKASENQVENTIRAITNHSSILSQTENESFQSEANDFSDRFSRSSSKTSSDSLWSQTEDVNQKTVLFKSHCDVDTKEIFEEYSNLVLKAVEENGNDGSYTSCRSGESVTTLKEMDLKKKVKTNLEEVINFKRLQTNINVIHQDVKTKRSENMRSSVLNDYYGYQTSSTETPLESTLIT